MYESLNIPLDYSKPIAIIGQYPIKNVVIHALIANEIVSQGLETTVHLFMDPRMIGARTRQINSYISDQSISTNRERLKYKPFDGPILNNRSPGLNIYYVDKHPRSKKISRFEYGDIDTPRLYIDRFPDNENKQIVFHAVWSSASQKNYQEPIDYLRDKGAGTILIPVLDNELLIFNEDGSNHRTSLTHLNPWNPNINNRRLI